MGIADIKGPSPELPKDKRQSLFEDLTKVIESTFGMPIDALYKELNLGVKDPVLELPGFVERIETTMLRKAKLEWVTIWFNEKNKVIIVSAPGSGLPSIRMIEEIFEKAAHLKYDGGDIHDLDEHEHVEVYQLKMDHEWFTMLPEAEQLIFIKLLAPAIG